MVSNKDAPWKGAYTHWSAGRGRGLSVAADSRGPVSTQSTRPQGARVLHSAPDTCSSLSQTYIIDFHCRTHVFHGTYQATWNHDINTTWHLPSIITLVRKSWVPAPFKTRTPLRVDLVWMRTCSAHTRRCCRVGPAVDRVSWNIACPPHSLPSLVPGQPGAEEVKSLRGPRGWNSPAAPAWGTKGKPGAPGTLMNPKTLRSFPSLPKMLFRVVLTF